jgi:3-oxoacyl-[acyl-carrier protein] reductase
LVCVIPLKLYSRGHFSLENKTAIVTGASGDIGGDIVNELARAGANIVALGRNLSRLRSSVTNAKKLGVNAVGLACDVKNIKSVKSIVRKIVSAYPKIDILVNNAGIGSLGDIESVSVKNWDEVIDTNLRGTFLFAKELVPIFRKQRYGRIINIASISAQTGGTAGSVIYTASKGGIIALTKTLSRDMAPFGVTVNAISPGVIDAGMGRLSVKEREKYEKMIPLGRVGTGKDVAYAVHFLASDEAEYITGTTLDVNGGVLKR